MAYTGITCREAVEKAANRALHQGNLKLHLRLLKIGRKLKKEEVKRG